MTSHGRDIPKILLVDDSPDALELMTMVLEQEGFASASVASAQEALEYLVTRPAPFCIFIDFDMPGMDGLDFVHRVRAGHADDIVLIAVTGSFGADEARITEFRERVDHHFIKPVDWKKLSRILSAMR